MNWAEFRERLTESLDSQELRTLCFDLNVDYDALRGEAKDGKIRELIALLRRKGRLPELAGRLDEIRPLTNWTDLVSQLLDRDALPDGGRGPFDKRADGARPGWLAMGAVGLGLAGLVLVAVLVITGVIGAPRADVNTSAPTVTPDEAIANVENDEPTENAEPSVEPPRDASCLDQFFAEIGTDRQVAIEAGERSRDFIVATQDRTSAELSDPYGIKLNSDGDVVAALIFRFRAEDVLFKISSVVDADCQAVVGYHNGFRPSVEDTLQDNDRLEIPLDDSTLSLRFNFQGTHIRFSFQEF